MTSKFSAEELFNSWYNRVKEEYQYGRFLFNNRAEILEDLLDMFIKNDVTLDEARMYRTKVLNTLVTKEGSKGQGKYKGWKETVSKDFDVMLVEMYESVVKNNPAVVAQKPDSSPSKNETLMDIIKQPIPKQPLIEVWGKVTYGDIWNEALSVEAHTFGTPMFNNFFYNVMKADWINKPDIMPAWAKGVIYGNN